MTMSTDTTLHKYHARVRTLRNAQLRPANNKHTARIPTPRTAR
jgi:hypothetical protein